MWTDLGPLLKSVLTRHYLCSTTLHFVNLLLSVFLLLCVENVVYAIHKKFQGFVKF